MEAGEKAVAIDPQFAMAHRLLVACYSSLPGYEDEAQASRERAFQASDHTSPRERFLIRGLYYMSRGRGSWHRALETFTEYVEAYPNDEIALLRLGQLQLLLEQWEGCIETLDRIPDDSWISSHLVYLRQAHSALGQYQTALEVAARANPGGDSFQHRHQLALNLTNEHRFEEALAEADVMLERSPGYAAALKLVGDIHLYRAEWSRAEASYRELLRPVGSESRRLNLRLDGLRRLASLYLTQGQFERALNVLDLAIDEVTALGETRWLVVLRCWKARALLARGSLAEADAETQVVLDEAARRDHVTGTTSALIYRGLIRLRQGDIPGAEKAAVELKAVLDGWLNPKLIRRWHHLAGEIDLAKGRLGDALAHHEQAVALLPHQCEPDGDSLAPYFSALANAYAAAGDLARARDWYEATLALTSGRLIFGDTYATSHLRLGKILQQQGREAEATRRYQAFLDLWRDADPSRPELEEARVSLAALSD
jgi:tetratricopeptide (TPR) repeat protein